MRYALIHIRGNVGDFVALSGVAGALKAERDELHIFTRKDLRAVEVLTHMPCFDSVNYFEHMPVNPNNMDQCDFKIDLRDTPWLYPVGLLRASTVVNLSHVPGFDGKIKGKVEESIYERYASLLKVPRTKIKLGTWAVRPEEALMAKNWIERNIPEGGPLVFFQYHATSKTRRLPPKIVEEVYDGLKERDLRVIIAYIERRNTQYLGLVTRRAASCTSLPIPLSAAVLAQSDLAVSVDTGFFHLACSFGIPSVGIFGPTNFGVTARYYPLAREARPKQVLDCADCYYRPWRKWSMACREEGCKQMAEHSAEMILSEVDAVLGDEKKAPGVTIRLSGVSQRSRAKVMRA